jgi:hypothetical protein
MREPLKLRKRPHYKGLPIPATAKIKGGIPDFADIDWDKAKLFGINRQCALCGYKIQDKKVAFIGGPLTAESKVYRDGPMHESCARYAAIVCPFLNGDKETYRHDSWIDPLMTGKRPEKIILLLAESYQMGRDILNHYNYRAVDPVTIEEIVLDES